MAIIATDNFNRANGTLGTNWTTGYDQGMVISSSQVGSNGVSGAGIRELAFWNANAFGNDQYAKIKLSTHTGTSNVGVGVAVRCNATAGGNGYGAMFLYFGGTYYIQVYKFVAGAGSLVQNITGYTWTVGDTLQIDVRGSNIFVSYNGAIIYVFNDTALTSGSAGLIGYDAWNTGAGGSSLLADNWESGDSTMPAYIQSANSGAGVSSTSVSVAYVSNNTAGNMLVALVRRFGLGTLSINDTQGNTWVQAGEDTSSTQWMEVYYALNCKAGANTVTFHDSVSQGLSMIIAEYCIPSTSAIDGITVGLNTNGSTTINAPALTTNGVDLVIGLFEQFQIVGGVPTASTGFTLRNSTTLRNNDLALTDQIAVAGTFTAGATWASTNGMGMAIAFIFTPTAPGFLQGTKSTQASNSTGASVAYATPNTAGNLLVAICGNNTGNITGISDTLGNTWTALPQQSATGNLGRTFYCTNCKGGMGNTVSFATATYSFSQIEVAEFRTVNLLDVSSQNVVAANVGTAITTNFAVELIVGNFQDSNGAYVAGTGYTTAVGSAVPVSSTTRSGIMYKIVSSTGTYTPILGASQSSTCDTLGFYLGSGFVPSVGGFAVGF